jgi:hypothetical protein
VEPTCPNGHRTSLERVERRRYPGGLVALGFTLLVVSLLGLAAGSAVLFAVKLVEQEPARTPDQIRADLQKESVPEPVIASVLRETGAKAFPDELHDLTPQQLEAVRKAQFAVVRSLVDPERIRGATWTGVAAALAGAVIGWLLRAKRSLLQCGECGAAVPV